jgi:hypothetical protein
VALVEKSRLKHHTLKKNHETNTKTFSIKTKAVHICRGSLLPQGIFLAAMAPIVTGARTARKDELASTNHASSSPCRPAERSAHAPVSGMRAERGSYEDEGGTNKNR